MEGILIGLSTALILAIACFVILYQRESRKDKQIFDEYLEKQRGNKFNRRGRGIGRSKKDSRLFK